MKAQHARLKNLLFHVRHARYREIVKKLSLRIYSSTSSYCLRRDLRMPFPAPQAKIPITVRRITDDDVSKVFNNVPGLPLPSQLELHARLMHLHANIPTCYVGVTDDGSPAYMQWLMGPDHNEKIQAFFNGTFPRLAPDEALLENALTLEEFRGKGIMPAAMAQIAEQAVALGARYVITFVEQHNIPSLKGCKKAGFVPHMLRREQWMLFRRTLEFTPLPPDAPYPFDAQQSPQPQQQAVARESQRQA